MPIVSAQCIIGNEKYPDTGILLNFDDDDYSQGYHQIKEAFRALIHYIMLPNYISEDEYRSNNDGYNSGCNKHAFDNRYQKNFEATQPKKVEFKFAGVIPPGLYGYALVLPIKLVSISSDGQRMFDLI